MEFRLWAIFSNFGQNMKGQKITAAAEISANQKNFFLLDQIQSTFSISEFFFSRLFLCKIIWLVVYPHFAVIFSLFCEN